VRRGLIPYLLTGLLTLGAGLGAGLGIAATSTAARHSSAVGPEVSCVTVAPPNEALSCTSARSEAITEMVLSFPEVKLPGTFDNCVTNAMERVWPMKPATTPRAQPGTMSLGDPGPSEALGRTAERDIVACGGPNVPF
jgi:hypothetical protein